MYDREKSKFLLHIRNSRSAFPPQNVCMYDKYVMPVSHKSQFPKNFQEMYYVC